MALRVAFGFELLDRGENLRRAGIEFRVRRGIAMNRSGERRGQKRRERCNQNVAATSLSYF